MRCPYCASEVPQAAIVCSQCARDFYLFKPLLDRVEQLESRLLEQTQAGSVTYEARIAALERELEGLKAAQFAVPGVAVPAGSGGHRAASRTGAALSQVSGTKQYWVSSMLALGPALALLVAAHIILLFVYDVKPLYLRTASILIPIPFGFALLVWHPNRFRISAIGGFAMAVVAVWLMLITTRGGKFRVTLDSCNGLLVDARSMVRPLRIEYAGAHYHVTSRGNEHRATFRDDTDRELFLSTLSGVVGRYRRICHAYCLQGSA